MSTTIEWTHRPGTRGETWNPIAGCSKVSPGCANCYALAMSHRLAHIAGTRDKYKPVVKTTEGHLQWTGKLTYTDAHMDLPLRWKQPRTVFVGSMTDIFHPHVHDDVLRLMWSIMANAKQHTFLVLTKRPERMAAFLNSLKWVHGMYLWKRHILVSNVLGAGGESPVYPNWWPKNIWVGTSVEDQTRANERIPHLVTCPGPVRFLSCEPLLGPVDIEQVPTTRLEGRDGQGNFTLKKLNHIDWVIAGGESGHKARPMHPDWVRSLRDQCSEAGVPFFFKQWGQHKIHDRLPIPLADLIRVSHYWEDGKYVRIQRHDDTPASILGKYPLACKVGKHAAGAELDGRTHREWPTVAEKEVPA